MSLETNTSKIRDEYLDLIPPKHREKVEQDEYFQSMMGELSENPDLAFLYAETFLHRNQQPLIEKTRNQIGLLKEMYFEPEQLITFDIIGEMRKRMRNTQKGIKLGMFEKYIDSMAVIKGGKNDFDKEKQEFLSSDITKPSEAFSGGYDLPVCAHRYTYCSFDKISHPQAIGAGYGEDVSVIDDSDFQGRAEMLTMDVADLGITSRKFKCNEMDLLLKNTFDYESGKKILALYCALIFKDVAEAEDFFHRNCGRMAADGWYKSPAYTIKHATELGVNPSHLKDGEGNSMMDLHFHKGMLDENGSPTDKVSPSMKRLLEIQDKMIKLFEQTGIAPPLELELRVPQRAKIKPGATFDNWVGRRYKSSNNSL
jgi:hypothetical protein